MIPEQEQACMKADLQIAHSKLEKSEREAVQRLETNLQHNTNSKNATVRVKQQEVIVRVKQQEVIKLWDGDQLESKISSTCDVSAQQLALEVQEAEHVKQMLDEKLAADLFSKKEDVEITAENLWQTEYTKLKNQRQEDSRHLLLAHEVARTEFQIHVQASEETVEEETATLGCVQKQVDQVQWELAKKFPVLPDLQERHVHLTKTKNDIHIQAEDFKDKLASEMDVFKGERERQLEKNNVANINKLLRHIFSKNTLEIQLQELVADEETPAQGMQASLYMTTLSSEELNSSNEMKDTRRKYDAEATKAILNQEQKASSMLETMKKDHESEIAKIQEAVLVNQRGCLEEHQAQIREILQKQEKYKNMAIEELNKDTHDFIQQKLWTQDLELKIEELQRKPKEEAEERVLNLEQQVNVLKEQLEEKLQREEANFIKCEEAVHNFEADHISVEENHKKSSMVKTKKKALFWDVREKITSWQR